MHTEKTDKIVGSAGAEARREPSRQGRLLPDDTCATIDLARAVVMHFELPDSLAIRARLMAPGLDLASGGSDKMPVIVSLLAGTVRDVRLHIGPRSARFVEIDGHEHPATPVAMLAHLARHRGQPVWRPLRVMLPRPEAMHWLRRFGVPSQHADVTMSHSIETGELSGHLDQFAWRGRLDHQSLFASPEPGSLDQHLLSPRGLYTADHWVQRRLDFKPVDWHVAHIEAEVDPGMINAMTGWPSNIKPRLIAAHFTPGLTDLQWRRPRCVNGPACGFLP